MLSYERLWEMAINMHVAEQRRFVAKDPGHVYVKWEALPEQTKQFLFRLAKLIATHVDKYPWEEVPAKLAEYYLLDDDNPEHLEYFEQLLYEAFRDRKKVENERITLG